jgi:hypothetical protein
MRKGKGPDPDPYLWLMDPVTGGPKHTDPDPATLLPTMAGIVGRGGGGAGSGPNNNCFPQLPPHKRGRFLGPAGLNMRRLTADTGVQVSAKDRLMFFCNIPVSNQIIVRQCVSDPHWFLTCIEGAEPVPIHADPNLDPDQHCRYTIR